MGYIIDSKRDKCPLKHGEYYEKYVYVKEGKYRACALNENEEIPISSDLIERDGFLHLEIFFETGQRFASSAENFEFTRGLIYFTLTRSLNLKFKVSRIGGNLRELDFIVDLHNET
jgi:hypothetical protein